PVERVRRAAQVGLVELRAVDADENLPREAALAEHAGDVRDAGAEVAFALQHDAVALGGGLAPVDIARLGGRKPRRSGPAGEILERTCREAPRGLGGGRIAEPGRETALRALRRLDHQHERSAGYFAVGQIRWPPSTSRTRPFM